MDANYASLDRVLRLAYAQSAEGKGKERHANSKAFDEQPIIEIARMVGAGFNTGQAMKKLQESMGMHRKSKHEAALAELLGAIVYTAAAYLVVEEAAQNEKDQYKLRIDEPVLKNGSGIASQAERAAQQQRPATGKEWNSDESARFQS